MQQYDPFIECLWIDFSCCHDKESTRFLGSKQRSNIVASSAKMEKKYTKKV
jgi:hypothetical protein